VSIEEKMLVWFVIEV